MNRKERIKQLDNVKWLLTLLIILYHIPYQGVSGAEEKLFMFIKNLGDCAVPAFAIISGFLFWVNVDNLYDVKVKMERRVFTLLVPYMLWNIINTLGLNLINSRELKQEIFNINIWNHIIKWDSSPHFWYVFMLIFWTVFAPVLYAAYKDRRVFVLLLLSQLIYLIYKGEGIYHSRFIYMIYTWGGHLGYSRPDIWNRIIDLKGKRILSLGTVTLYFTCCFFIAAVDIGMQIKVWVYALKAVLFIIFTINLPFWGIGKMTILKYSFWIFAVHYWLDHFVSILVGRYINGVIYQLATWLLVFVIALLSGKFINKVCPNIFRVLNGDRANV